MDFDSARRLRWGMLALVVAGTTGIAAELVVLEHYADANQRIPLAVAAAGLLAALWVAVAPHLLAVRVWQFMMLVFVGTGLTGITMHADVVSDVVSPPLLAPGLFVQLGLLGLLYTYRHPSLGADH